MEMKQKEQILCTILDAGEQLLVSGAEVARVEDTICRMASAYGFVRVDVLTITASMIVTAQAEDGAVLTQTRRIRWRDTDMRRVEAVNALSRRVCSEVLPLEVLRTEVAAIRGMPSLSPLQMLLSYLIISGSFAMFFGGSLRDGLAAMVCSVVLYEVGRIGNRVELQPIVLTVLSAAIMCASAVLTVKIGLGQALDKIVIGNIMLMITGVALVNSLRDMIVGDTISGLLGAAEAILRAIAIAAGCALVLMQLGGTV